MGFHHYKNVALKTAVWFKTLLAFPNGVHKEIEIGPTKSHTNKMAISNLERKVALGDPGTDIIDPRSNGAPRTRADESKLFVIIS